VKKPRKQKRFIIDLLPQEKEEEEKMMTRIPLG
jgi:hypothetical protein